MTKLPFLQVVTDITAKYNKIKNEDYLSKGLFPIIDQGQTFIGGYSNNLSLVNKEDFPVIVFGDHTKALKYIDFPFTIGADGVKVLKIDEKIASVKYVFYFLKTIKLPESGYSRHFKYLKDVKLPITERLSDQLHIANILNRAENLIAERKESIRLLDEYLKSTFLEMFGDPTINNKGWRNLELKEFGNIITGNTPSRKDDENYSSKTIEWIKSDNINSDKMFISEAVEYLSEKGFSSARSVDNGALLVACIAGSIESIGRAALTNRKVSFNQQINAIQPFNDVSPLFLYALFKLSKYYIQNQATKGMKKILTKGEFEKIKMIKPPLELQNEFANIVEKTETLKFQYQSSLQELENLYHSLSQQAFKGELNAKDEELLMAAESRVEYNTK